MGKSPTATSTKTASRAAKEKTTKAEPKEKRAPTAYNIFVKESMAKWKAENPDAPHKEAMAGVAAMWADSPENPKRGQPVKKRAPKAETEKATKADKENKAKAPRAAKKAKAVVKEASESEDEDAGSDD